MVIIGQNIMSLRLFYNPSSIVVAILLSAIIAVYFVDYKVFFDVNAVEAKNMQDLKAMGVVDKFFAKYSHSKYVNVVNNNIFAENVTTPKETNEKVVLKTDTTTLQLEIRGVVTTPEGKMVLVWDKEKNESHVLSENDTLKKWKIIDVSAQKVILGNEAGDLYEVFINKETATDLYIIR